MIAHEKEIIQIDISGIFGERNYEDILSLGKIFQNYSTTIIIKISNDFIL